MEGRREDTLAGQGPTAIAEHLTESLKATGDLDVASAPMDMDQ